MSKKYGVVQGETMTKLEKYIVSELKISEVQCLSLQSLIQCTVNSCMALY